ncbi:hypothetical protein ACIGKG_05045 [Streptomyces rochei]|uniref:hypothetical protein n=1 Tax=Streptomyces rochei TaxID=1928 RepID=UPI0037CE22C2
MTDQPWSQLEARAFNAVQPALREAGEWLPLTARRKIAQAVLAAVREHLDISGEEAWCKTCRRVWEGPRHRCESDAERRLAHLRGVASTWFVEGEPGPTRNAGKFLLGLLDQPAHNTGPTVAEAAADDRRWWNGEKAGE